MYLTNVVAYYNNVGIYSDIAKEIPVIDDTSVFWSNAWQLGGVMPRLCQVALLVRSIATSFTTLRKNHNERL